MPFGSATVAGAQIGGPVGGAIGAGVDLFALFSQRQDSEQEARRFSEQQRQGQALESNSLGMARVQESLNAAQALEDLERGGEMALGAANQSALESGVAGNSVQGLNLARRMQIDRVRRRIMDRQEQVDAEFNLQNAALRLRTQASITSAVLELENNLPSIFELIGGGLAGAGAIDSFEGGGDVEFGTKYKLPSNVAGPTL